MPQNEEVKPWRIEQAELMRKLEKPYEDEEQKKIDLKRLSELDVMINTSNRNFINDLMRGISQTVKVEEKPLTIKEQRKMISTKYETYKQLALSARELYQELVEKKKAAKEIFERLKGGESCEDDVLGY